MTAPNLADLRALDKQPNDLPAIVAEFLQQCGPCDAGLPMGCTCSKRDYRPTMSRLVDEVEALRRIESEAKSQLRDISAVSMRQAAALTDVLALADKTARKAAAVRSTGLARHGLSDAESLMAHATSLESLAGEMLRAITNHVTPDAPASEATETKG